MIEALLFLRLLTWDPSPDARVVAYQVRADWRTPVWAPCEEGACVVDYTSSAAVVEGVPCCALLIGEAPAEREWVGYSVRAVRADGCAGGW